MSHQAYGPRTARAAPACACSTGRASGRLSSSRATPPSAGRRPFGRSAMPATRSPATATCTKAPVPRPTRRPRSAGCCAVSRRSTRRRRPPDRLSRARTGSSPTGSRRCSSSTAFGTTAGSWTPTTRTGSRRAPNRARRRIVELPAHWSLDDWEPYNYLPGLTGSGVIASPADVIARWTLELEALVDEGGAVHADEPPVRVRAGVTRGRPRAADRARPARSTASGSRPRPRSPSTWRRSTSSRSSTSRPSFPRSRGDGCEAARPCRATGPDRSIEDLASDSQNRPDRWPGRWT